MVDWTLITFGVMCTAALVVAVFSKVDRPCLVKIAAVLWLNWFCFSMPWIYAPASFEFVMHNLGLPGKQEHGWAINDMLSVIVCVTVCWRVWWAPLVWSPFLVNLSMLAVATTTGLRYTDYHFVLDASLVVQIAVIFSLGGGGVRDRVLGSRLLRRVLGISIVAPYLARKRG